MVLCVVFINIACIFLSTTADCTNKKETYVSGDNTNVEEALQFLKDHDRLASENENKLNIANWNYESNITEENKKIMLNSSQEAAEFDKAAWENATSYSWKDFKDINNTIYRWFKHLSILGSAALPEDKFNELTNIITDMDDTFEKAKVCPYNALPCKSCNLALNPDLTETMSTSQNYDELTHIWSQWRDLTGKQLKDKFLKYVELSNEAACLNGFSDAGEMWRETYESETFEKEIEELLCTLFPFYQHLHAYVRGKLIERYPSCKIKPDGPIPAHLLGNMWGQTWGNIFEKVKPFPDKESPDATKAMQQKNMTALDMYKLSEEFFTSLGLIKMTPEFWNRSIIEKPTDRDMVCHPSAWDFSDGKDFRADIKNRPEWPGRKNGEHVIAVLPTRIRRIARSHWHHNAAINYFYKKFSKAPDCDITKIKQCARVNMEDLMIVHHEMGHVEYFMQYADQPFVFREGPNAGFHEAVGDTIALSVATPQHLKKVNLLEEFTEDEENDINTLLNIALDKIAFIPFAYVIDSWRWRVFDGSFKKEELNAKWWELRLKYQGLCPPVKRTNDDLDAASKYHVVADVPYIRYFVSYIIQFQFHKALCDEAGYEGPLHKCDIYQNKEAGKLLSQMLSLGSSKPWKEAMSIITKGKTDKMDAKPILEYFTPLLKWLKEQNKNKYIGWKSYDPMECP